VLLTGQAEITIDAKQRLAVPAKFRARIPERETGWYCLPWPDGSMLRLYPQRIFESLAERLEDSLTAGSDSARIDTTLFGFAELIEMDAAGRVRLPKWHLELVGLHSDGAPVEVMVVGSRNRLEVHARDAWRATLVERFRDMASQIERSERRGPA
jgi:MraZ protein